MHWDYQSMRTFADSWGLLFMFIVFLIVIVRTFRPSARKAHEDASSIPFKES